MSYKILKQTDKAFQIEHPDGSTFTVPRKGLSKSMMDKIEKMPGFAEGGPISVNDPMTRQGFEVGQMLRENEREYQKRLARPSESAISPGYLPEAPVTESEISPIDFITPGMVAAPIRALGRGASVIGREAIEAAPRILGNEIGAIGSDVKAGLSNFDKIKELEKQIAELMSQKNSLMKEARSAAAEGKPLEPVSFAEKELPPTAKLRKDIAEQNKIMGISGEPTPGTKAYEKQAEALSKYTERKLKMPISEAGGKFMTLEEINAERVGEGLPRLTKKQINASNEYEASPSTTTERGETFYRSKTQKAGAKPDLRSGKLESQSGIQAMVHEPAHIISGPKNMKIGDFQEWMDEGSRRAGSLKTAAGESRQGAAKQIQEEIQPMALENPLRRRAGLPVFGRPQYTDPGYGARMTPISVVETPEGLIVQPELIEKGKYAGQIRKVTPEISEWTQPRVALDTGEQYATRLRDPKTQEIFDYIAQSKNISPENLQRLRDFDENVIRYHPERGLVESNSPEALINLRGQGRFEDAAKRLKTRGEDRFAHGGKVGENKSMSYRIIKDAEDHYQVLHPDGTKFTVPKKGISKQMHEKISGMPKLYDGGLMSDAEMEQSAMIPKSAPSMPLDSDLASVQAQIDDAAARQDNSSDTLMPLYDKKEKILNAQKAMMEAPKMPSQAVEPTRVPAVSEEEPSVPAATTTPAVTPAPAAAPVNSYDATFNRMEGRLGAGTKALANAERDYQTRTLLAQNEAEVRQQEMSEYIASADKEAAEFAEKNKIDPGRYWSSMDTGNKVQAALALALGGIGAGLSGGPNHALGIINKAIDADIDAQKENKNSLYNIMLNKHKRHETALSVAKADALQKVQNALNTFSVQAKTAEAQQGAAKLANDIDLQKMAYKDYFQKKNASDFLNQKAAIGATLTPLEIEQLPEESRKRFINGVGKAQTPEGAAKIKVVKTNTAVISDMVDQLANIRQQSGRELLPTVAAERADSIGRALIGQMREAILGPGVMDKAERASLEKMIPTVTSVASLDANVFARLDAIKDMVTNNYEKTLLSEGMIVKPRPKKNDSAPGLQQGLILNK
jgi:hypothetical protein